MIFNAEKLVAKVLKEQRETRSDDVLLVLAVWEEQGLKLTDGQKALARECLSSETITRWRRKIQSEGLYKADPLVEGLRKVKQLQFAKRFSHES